MILDRRTFVSATLATLAGRLVAQQGMASRNVAPQARATASGHPFSRFVDVAQQAGLTLPVIYGGVDHKEYILEAIGCGCAFIDYDNDGWLDIFLLGGMRFDGTPAGATNRLYKNNRDGSFTDVTEAAGLHNVGWASGVCVGDYNNDGWEDLFCTAWGQNKLYRNNGNGTFTDVTKSAGLLNSEVRWGAGCSFLDYDRDGHLDLFVSNYVQFDLEHVPSPGRGANCTFESIPVNCGPRGLPPGYHSLYHNNGDGTFTDVSRSAGISRNNQSYGLTVVTADLDEDGWPDILVACDSTPSLLYLNNHDGAFREAGLERGVAFSDDGSEQAGMGLGIGDYDLDGHTDFVKTHFTGDANGLFRNDGKGYFSDVTRAARLAVETRFTCWGAGMYDLDNDGYPDIFLVSGSVYPEVGKEFSKYPDRCPRLIFRNLGDKVFEELMDAGPGVASAHSSRGCAFGDFDNDGDMDVLIVNLNESPSLLRNDCITSNHWLKVKLVGVKSNRSAIGAKVMARYGKHTQLQERLSQSSFLSSNDPRLHFGLGAERSADLVIVWPNGLREELKGVAADRLITVEEGRGIVFSSGSWSPKH